MLGSGAVLSSLLQGCVGTGASLDDVTCSVADQAPGLKAALVVGTRVRIAMQAYLRTLQFILIPQSARCLCKRSLITRLVSLLVA